MRFLIIDDDDFKIQQFTNNLHKEDTFIIKQSYRSGLNELIANKEKYDCLILDMNFPHFDNEIVKSDEGLRILEQIKIRKIDIPIIIYSSKYVDISEYENVRDYIMFNGMCDLKQRIKSIKNNIK